MNTITTSTIAPRKLLCALLVVGTGFLLWGISSSYQATNALGDAVYQHIDQGILEADLSSRALAQLSSAPTTAPAEVGLLLAHMDQQIGAGLALPALALGQEALTLDPDNVSVMLRLGMVYLQQRQYAEAETNLLAVHEAQTSATTTNLAAWYLALLYATYGDEQRTRQFLQEAAGAPHFYQKKATQLLSLMDG